MTKSIIKYSFLFFLFTSLTILTQVGGVILFLSIWLSSKVKAKNTFSQLGLFIIVYLLSTLILVPPIAKMSGRVALPISNKGLVIPNHIWTCLLNRHYVKPELYKLIHDAANTFHAQKKGNIKLRYLDANFPFINGFPLLPHRSHDDGEKIDLAFMYVDRAQRTYWNDSVSFLGYGFCEAPLRGEQNTPQQCAQKGYWQYSLLTKAFGLGNKNEIQFDEFASSALIKILSKHPSTKKIFIEPHLKTRLGFGNDAKVRFHGCAAVRHDDHIHIEL